MINSFTGEYRFLSNFYFCIQPILLEGLEFSTVEHAYQASKTLDMHQRRMIQSLNTPSQAKKMGGLVKMREDWTQVKIPMMNMFLMQKFSNQPLFDKLKATRPHELIEGNEWGDTFWGVCNGKGCNHLGKLLMAIRDDIFRGQ